MKIKLLLRRYGALPVAASKVQSLKFHLAARFIQLYKSSYRVNMDPVNVIPASYEIRDVICFLRAERHNA